jgi:hypothetical protein
MPEAGHEIAVYAVQQLDATAAPSALATYQQICGMDSLEFNEERVSLEKTNFKCSSDARSKFLGLFDGSGSLSGYYDPADVGQVELNDAFTGASDAVLWLMIAWDGVPANGNDHVKCVVTNRTRSVSVDGRVEVSYSLEFSGKVLAGPTT